MGITLQAVTAEKNLTYEREASAAIDAVDRGAAQIAFLLNPVDVEKVMRIATAGEVMPQKSTDFYPKLLSGITMYRVDFVSRRKRQLPGGESESTPKIVAAAQ